MPSGKNGSTAEIARWIGEVLREQHIDAEVAPVSGVPSVAAYDAVILGAGLYAGRRPREAVRFVRHHRQALTEQDVWLFSSGPLNASAPERWRFPPVSERAPLEPTVLHPAFSPAWRR